jgi:hypothetical protein
MAVQDDLRRLSQLDGIYIGHCVYNAGAVAFWSWFKGRLQQSNDGAWIVRSVSSDGTVCGFQLSIPTPNWNSNETPESGIVIGIPINSPAAPQGQPAGIGSIELRQQLPSELTN